MRAWQSHANGGELVAVEVAEPAPGPTQVVVAVEAAVVAAPELAGPPHLVAGGAGIGRVVAAGEAATDLLDRRVLVGPEQPCGECDLCRRGGAVLCRSALLLGRNANGTLAERVVASARWVCPLDGDLQLPDAEAAVLAREAAWAYAMLASASVAPGEPVIIVGDSVVTRLLAALAEHRGTRPIVGVRRGAAELAAEIGERGRVIELDGDVASARELAARAAAELGHGERPAKIFETSADSKMRALALALAGPRAHLTLLAADAIGAAPAAFDLGEAIEREVSVVGFRGAHPDLLPELAALVVKGELEVQRFATVHPDVAAAAAAEEALPRAAVALIGR